MQTIEEKFIDLYNEKINNAELFDSEDIIEISHYSFIEGAKFAQQWINIEEQLPEHRQDLLEDTPLRIKKNGNTGFIKTKQVLVKFRNGNFDIGRRCKCCTDDYYCWDCLESFEKNNPRNIIAWRPININ